MKIQMNIIHSDCFAIQRAVTLVGTDVVSKLEEFYLQSSKLENDYKSYALRLIEQTLKVNHSGETKKQLTELLLGLGFKKSNVSSMIGAQDFVNELEARKSQAAEAVKALPVPTAYRLATCSEDACAKIWTKDWDYGNNTLSKQQVIDLKNKYEKPDQKFARTNSELSNLEKAKKLLTDYPDIVALIEQHLEESS